MLFPPLRIPPVPRRYGSDNQPPIKRIIVRRTRHPIQKRLPDFFRLRRVQPLADHVDFKRVFGIHMRLLSPMVVEEMLPIEAHELADQTPIGIIRRRLDLEAGVAKELGKVVQLERNLTDDAEGASSSALERPEQIGAGAGVRDPDLSVSGDDFRLEQAGRRSSIVLRETSEAAALQQPREAHG